MHHECVSRLYKLSVAVFYRVLGNGEVAISSVVMDVHPRINTQHETSA